MRFFGTKGQELKSSGDEGSQVPADQVVQFSSIVNSSLSTRTGAVQLSVAGIAGLEGDPSDLDDAENTDDGEQYSAPGVIGRPLPPRNVNGNDLHMDVVAIRTADGLVPIAYRDLRLKMGGNAPAEGQLAFVGYGGGFVSHTPVAKGDDPSGGGTITTFYCPFAFDSDGVPTKSHAIILDPTEGNESVMVVHANGMAITMFEQTLLMKNASGNATFRLDDNGITMTAARIVLSGGVVVGEPAAAVPLLAGPASPGSTKFWVSP